MKKGFILFLLVFTTLLAFAEQIKLKINLTENSPLVFPDKDGHPAGFFPDILEYIADKEGWDLEFVFDTWKNSLNSLENGEIDIVQSIAHSEERDKVFDFNNRAVISNWGQLSRLKGTKIESLPDLQGKKVSGDGGNIHTKAFLELIESFDIDIEFTDTDDYFESFELLDRGEVAACISNRFNTLRYLQQYKNVEKTPIIFNPINLHFATTKGENADILATIDEYIERAHTAPNSFFYQAMDRWIGTSLAETYVFPMWAKLILIVAGGIVFMLGAVALLLRQAVEKRTVTIIKQNRELKEAQTKLRERAEISEEKFETFIESMADSVFAFDRDWKYILANEMASKFTGKTRKEFFSGKSILEIFPGFEDTSFFKVYKKVMETREPETTSGKYIFEDGREGWYEVRVSPTPEGIVCVARDITERKKVEEELRNTEQKLLQSQKLESVGRLAGGVAHDFNNLLTTILGYTELISMEQDLTATMNEGVQEIKKSAERAASLTQQLLAFSRKQIMRPQQIDLNKLIKNLRKMLTRLIHENITFSTNLDTGIGEIKADPVQIEQVIMNLAVNARDAMPDGGTLTIETHKAHLDESYRQEHPQVSPGDYVLLAVSDTGQGMDEETIDHIFDPFYTTKEVGKGTGLGLSTVYGIVKQSEGHIWAYSEPDHGTTFKIYLPAIEETEKQQESLPEKRDLLGGTETILLVEDEESLRKMAGKILERYGYAVIEAKNGIEALEISSKGDRLKIDLLVTDVIMPKMGGKELSDTLLKEYPRLRVLYISGYTDNAMTHHAVLDKGVSLLQKPFSSQSLAEKVREVLDED